MSIPIRSRGRALAAAVLAFAARAHADGASVAAPARDAGMGEPDDMAKYAERVQQGMQHYAAGAFREAIGWWDPVYRELGQHKAYRLSFNLARAYEKFSDFTLAAEHYEAFLSEVIVRRKSGEAIVPIVEKEETEAEDRLKQLRETKARIRVNAGARPTDVRIDTLARRASGFVAYVVPGSHTVTFLNGGETVETTHVVVDAGEEREVTPPAPPIAELPPAPRLRRMHEKNRPFPLGVLYAGGGVTAAAVIVPILAYGRATRLSNLYNEPTTARDNKAQLSTDYSSARTVAYATLAIPLSLAAITGGFTAFYFLGTKERDILVAAPLLLPVPGGMVAGASGHF